MKKLLCPAAIAVGVSLASLAHPTQAADHNNLDAHRPLSFDDAEAIGWGEQSLELGASFVKPNQQDPGGELELEYLYGVAPNTHLDFGIEAEFGGRTNTSDTDFDPGRFSVGIFHNFNREYGQVPAFSMRTSLGLPTSDGDRGLEVHWRGIASKTIGSHNRLHLNLDLDFKTDPEAGERTVIPGLILGYSRPLGLPRRFDRTFLSELKIQGSEQSGGGTLVSAGMGLRQQIGYQRILDLGIQTDLIGDAPERNDIRLTVGLSQSF